VPVVRFFHPRLSGILAALNRVGADLYYQRNAGMITGVVAAHCRKHGKVFVYGAGSDADFSFRGVLIDGLRDRVMFHYGLRHAHGVVVQNCAQAESAAPVIKSPVVMIPNGVFPASPGNGERDGTILYAGALRAVKRPNLFIELARRIPERKFVMLGGSLGTELDYGAAIEKEAAGVPNLTLTGWRPHSDVIREIAGAALVVNTSAVEGFPNVYLEAWNLGVPVVSFNDVDGLLAREHLGVLCTDLDDMEGKIRALLNDDALRRETGARARRLVEERFSPAVLGPRYVQFFEMLLERNRRGV